MATGTAAADVDRTNTTSTGHTIAALPTTPQSTLLYLQVGEERFTTSAATVAPSEYLSSLASGRWPSTQPDGSYFIDADPHIFKHILRYLRHGVYPLCYSRAHGGWHDYATYAAIHQLADYLGIPALVTWFYRRRWMSAIEKHYHTDVVEGEDLSRTIPDSDVMVRHYPTWTVRKKYVCPRGIAVHHDNKGKCGKACMAARGEAEDEYEECAVLTTLVVTEKLVFNRVDCVNEEMS
ncbi:MAG: hypothetical protein Q9222_006039 [Ikaeria aurantiellina]